MRHAILFIVLSSIALTSCRSVMVYSIDKNELLQIQTFVEEFSKDIELQRIITTGDKENQYSFLFTSKVNPQEEYHVDYEMFSGKKHISIFSSTFVLLKTITITDSGQVSSEYGGMYLPQYLKK